LFVTGCDDISSADVASLLREAIQIGHSPSKWRFCSIWNEPFRTAVLGDSVLSANATLFTWWTVDWWKSSNLSEWLVLGFWDMMELLEFS